METREPVADVRTARLPPAMLVRLWADLEAAACIVRVSIRERPGGPVEVSTEGVAGARRALEAGASVQLRYRYDGDEWSDTLIPDGDGARLVRRPVDAGSGSRPLRSCTPS